MKRVRKQWRWFALIILTQGLIFTGLYLGIFIRLRFQSAEYQENIRKIRDQIRYSQENGGAIRSLQHIVEQLKEEHDRLADRFVREDQLPQVLQQTALLMGNWGIRVLEGSPAPDRMIASPDSGRIVPVYLSWRFSGPFLPMMRSLDDWKQLSFYQQPDRIRLYRDSDREGAVVAEVISKIWMWRENR